MAISDWGTANTDFINYVVSGGDDNNYVFALHTDASVGSAIANGLMYDLSKLDCLDFSAEKFARNKLHIICVVGDQKHVFYCKTHRFPPNSVRSAQRNLFFSDLQSIVFLFLCGIIVMKERNLLNIKIEAHQLIQLLKQLKY